ncbi:DUF3891 family protein [Granulosicoccus sp. 3-233]|uniref:DUF3891 family protein n=1 Tax=Granulosicoccus sp. 3-233 TaxID=3417969 RepID=UPI003D34D5A1
MFESTRRTINFTQYEHMRLAGILAQHWGNDDFDRPELPSASFNAGVALHDLGFGTCDEFAIGAMSAVERAYTLERLMNTELSDRVAETVVKHHALRLMDDDEHALLKNECRQRIRALAETTQISEALYQRADAVTAFCDSVAFHFCFEKPFKGAVSVYPRRESRQRRSLSITMNGEGLVQVSPWPFDQASLDGYLLAFERETYPSTLRAIQVPWEIKQ